MSESVVVPLSLATARQRAGLTADALADLVGVTQRAVYAWERGESRMAPGRVAAVVAALELGDLDELALRRWADGESAKEGAS